MKKIIMKWLQNSGGIEGWEPSDDPNGKISSRLFICLLFLAEINISIKNEKE